MKTSFAELNLKRRSDAKKNPHVEDFLGNLNDHLESFEQSRYRDIEIEQPYVFVFGLPRSGTTLLSQVLANGLECGYINNVAARFWRAPVTGIRIARAITGSDARPGFESSYGATSDIGNIHEFGYFWRSWLDKDTFEAIAKSDEREDSIDWRGLRHVLANVQAEFNCAVVMKNSLGSYHLQRMIKEFRRVIYVYVDRDELDVAVSILRARQKYYEDLNQWWSYVPPDFEKVIDRDYYQQIAGQIVLLQGYYEKQFDDATVRNHLLRVSYRDLVRNPGELLEAVSRLAKQLFDNEIQINGEIPELTFRSHTDTSDERERLRLAIAEIRHEYG